jgi:hypothetical protein
VVEGAVLEKRIPIRTLTQSHTELAAPEEEEEEEAIGAMIIPAAEGAVAPRVAAAEVEWSLSLMK